MKTKPFHRGYTLIEMVIYIALIAGMVALSISAITSVYRIFGMLRIEQKISLSGDTAMETIIRDLRAASAVDRTASTLGSHPGVLKIGTKTFSISDIQLQVVEEGVSDARLLTADDIRVTNLVFYHATSTSSTVPSEMVTIQMTLEAGKGFFEQSKEYFGSAVLRGAY